MPELHAFRALRYDASHVGELSDVLCPPFDVISVDERARLAALHPANAVHVELPTSYAEAAQAFARWQADGTLIRDEQPLIYVYEQVFRASDGGEVACRGFFCRLRLEEYGAASGVRPHERTLSAAKEDRFELMQAVSANLSPVLFLYDDTAHGDSAKAQLDEITALQPAVDTLGPGGPANRMWLVDPAHSASARTLLELAAARPVVIADGHHRYETALRYCAEVGGDDGAGSVLALMYEAHSGGLALRPWHRVLKTADPAVLARVRDWYPFRLTSSANDLLIQLAAIPTDRPGVFGLWTASGGGVLDAGGGMLDAGGALADQAKSSDGSSLVRRLDVSVLSATLSRMFGASAETLAAEGRLTYATDAAKAIHEVESRHADAAFLVRPTPVDDVLAVAAAGDFMPAKSTLFYPKAATGLVFNPLSD